MPLPETSSGLLWVAERFGFAGLVAIILLIWGRQVILALVVQIAAMSKEISIEMADLTKAVTLATLAMSFAPKGIHDQATEIKTHVESRQAKRKP